jgi:hypothetical protein
MSTKTIAALLIALTPAAAACAASAPLPVYTPPSANPVTIAPVPEGGSTPVPEGGGTTYVPRREQDAGPQPTQPEQTVDVPLTPLLPSEVITSEVIATEESTSESTPPLPTPSLTGE